MDKTTGITGFAPINGAQLYYEVAGSGPAMVFTHAGVADHRLWDDQFAHFAQHYRVVRYDMRGFGKSEPVAGPYSRAADLAGLLDFLQIEQAILVGCSMGGAASMDVTLAQPQRVRALVMVCSSPTGLQLDLPRLEKYREVDAAEAAGDWERIAELEAQIWFDGCGRTPEQVDPVKRAKALAMNRLALAHEQKGLGELLPPVQPCAAERLGELALPVLVLTGEYDVPAALAAGEIMAKEIPGVQVQMLRNTAHLPSLELPGEFNAVLGDFLVGVGRV